MMPLAMEVGLGPGHIVLDWDPAAPQKGGTVASPHPQFSAHVYCSQLFAHLSNFWTFVIWSFMCIIIVCKRKKAWAIISRHQILC